MRSFLQVLVAATALPAVLALPQSWNSEYSVFEKLVQAPRGWTRLADEVPSSATINLQFHLTQENAEAFEQHVMDISTPDHPSYGNHLSAQEVQLMLQPSDATVSSVVSWLSSAGYANRAAIANDWVKLSVTVAEAEELLKTKYSYFQNESGERLLRTLSVQLPKNVIPHVDLVQPTTAMLQMTPQRSWLSDHESFYGQIPEPGLCNSTALTPSCITKLYHLDAYKPKGFATVGVSGYLEEYVQKADLEKFLETFVPEKAGTSFPVVSIDGGLNLQDGETNETLGVGEANLDIQWTTGLNAPIVNTYYTTAGRGPIDPTIDNPAPSTNEPYIDQLNYLLSLEKPPTVLSTSYGEPEISVPISFRKQVCRMFAQLGARGVSVVFSSGDLGPGSGCLSNDGKNRTVFEPIFPAACPWVTSVGGTKGVPETAVELSSGGFSETWERPSYQKKAVAKYFEDNKDLWKPFEQYFVKSGRAFPDVAGPAQNLTYVAHGNVSRVGGTSAAAPIFAATISLVNDFRLSHGKKVLGFLNPTLYQNPGAFSDITTGSSKGCNGISPQSHQPVPGGAIVPNAGWKATVGWDPATGLGTPRLDKLLHI